MSYRIIAVASTGVNWPGAWFVYYYNIIIVDKNLKFRVLDWILMPKTNKIFELSHMKRDLSNVQPVNRVISATSRENLSLGFVTR